jgi:hypothetical protein
LEKLLEPSLTPFNPNFNIYSWSNVNWFFKFGFKEVFGTEKSNKRVVMTLLNKRFSDRDTFLLIWKIISLTTDYIEPLLINILFNELDKYVEQQFPKNLKYCRCEKHVIIGCSGPIQWAT